MTFLPCAWSAYKCGRALQETRGESSFITRSNRSFNEQVKHAEISVIADLNYGFEERGSMRVESIKEQTADGPINVLCDVVVVHLECEYYVNVAPDPAQNTMCVHDGSDEPRCDVSARYGPASSCYYCAFRDHIPTLRGFRCYRCVSGVEGEWPVSRIEIVFTRT